MRKLLFAAFVLASALPIAAQPFNAAELRQAATDYYAWRRVEYPVSASDQGAHENDDKLTDYSPAALERRRVRVENLFMRLNATAPAPLSRDDEIDRILFRSQIARARFSDRVLQSELTNPQVYVDEASNAVFSLIKKDYAPAATRARAATARFQKMPAMFEQARRNLTAPIALYSRFAIASARAIDPLFMQSLEPLRSSLSGRDKQSFETARNAAIRSAHAFADWLEERLPSMAEWRPIGVFNYEFLLRDVLLLPFSARDVAQLGEIELARYRAMEALLPDPRLANPDPRRAASIPADQQAFLKAYESREEEMMRFLRENRLVTIPDYIGRFEIRQLPEAFKPTSPGGFMNAPGVYDRDSSGFYFIPTYNPESRNFYIRAAIEDPRPLLGHEGIPGHFLQISIANHNQREIRRQHYDSVFSEGWALYTEEMLLRQGLYAPNSGGAGQILRLSRYRAARIGADVNLHTGRWKFDEAVQYFIEGGGLDPEAAEGEAAGAANDPTQKISYIVGKWQIMQLLGKYRDMKGANFRLGEFHDELLSNGTMPVSVLEWLLLDDPTSLEKAVGRKLR